METISSMELFGSSERVSEGVIIETALSGNRPLSSYILELEKLQTSVTQRIQVLATNYHENILDHHSSLQDLGQNIKNLMKKAHTLQERTGKLGNELENTLEKMNDGVAKLEKVQQASEMVRIAQQFFMKTKKTRVGGSGELQELVGKLRGISLIEKIYRENEKV